MLFCTHHTEDIPIGGTSFVGMTVAHYNVLVATFGEPMESDDYPKVQAEWHVKFDDGTIATIYDWKVYPNKPELIFRWHVGGHSVRALELVGKALESGESYTKRRETSLYG